MRWGRLALIVALCWLALPGCSAGRSQGDQPGPGAGGRTSGAVVACASGPTLQGIDVSDHQGPIDWAAVAASGVRFAIARVAFGVSGDPTFPGHWEAIRANGMVRGAYLFHVPVQDAAEQAWLVVDTVGVLGPGDLPVTIDVEWSGTDPTVAHLAEVAAILEAGTGKRPMIYTAPGFWNQFFSDEFAGLDLWVAHWGVPCPDLPAGWSSWVFWQTSGGGGQVPGVAGGVDTDLFNGSETDLALAAGQPPYAGCSMEKAIACARAGGECWNDECVDSRPDDLDRPELSRPEPPDEAVPHDAADLAPAEAGPGGTDDAGLGEHGVDARGGPGASGGCVTGAAFRAPKAAALSATLLLALPLATRRRSATILPRVGGGPVP